jgi:hypothetical protein
MTRPPADEPPQARAIAATTTGHAVRVVNHANRGLRVAPHDDRARGGPLLQRRSPVEKVTLL